MQATVISVSENTNSFGYKGILALAPDGRGTEMMQQAYGTDPVVRRGENVDTADARFVSHRDLPGVPPARAAKVIAAAKKLACQSTGEAQNTVDENQVGDSHAQEP
jgi:hypothetical protein